jgi:multidrug resistance efflux pump
MDGTLAALEKARNGPRREEIQAAAELAAAEARYTRMKRGFREEEVRQAKNDWLSAEAVVRSPSKAVVDVVSVRTGDLVAPGQTVLRILKADDLWVKVFIPETELERVRLGQDATVTVDSYLEKRFPGRVVQIATQSEFTPRNIQTVDERRHQVFAAKVRVEDPQGVFKSGMAAEATFVLSGVGGR